MTNNNKNVFTSTTLTGIDFKNKIIRSATHEGMADKKGFPQKKLTKLYTRLAKGGVGAIITGYTGVQQDGKGPMLNMLMIDNDDVIPAFKELTDAVHEHETSIILQIAHCGRQTRSKVTGFETKGPSAKPNKFYSERLPKELSEKEILAIIDNFVSGVQRAKTAGFDGAQLHLAHGYLLSDFLSSHSNNRSDKWGGSLENKYRIVKMIFRKIKEKIGDFPILVKINAYDGQKNGMNISEAVKIAKMLEQSGCSAIEVSCGVVEDGLYTMRGEKLPIEAAMKYTFKYKNLPSIIKTIAKPFLKVLFRQPKPLIKYNLDAALKIKQAVNIPVIVVGGFNNIKDINNVIEKTDIDFVSMCRPFIIEPNIVNKFSKGIEAKSKCIMCNYCAILCEEKPLKCYFGKLPENKNN